MASASAGWYEDPDDPAHDRYWNGQLWTDQRRSKTGESNQNQAPGWFPDPVDGQGMRYWDGAQWSGYTYDPVPAVESQADEPPGTYEGASGLLEPVNEKADGPNSETKTVNDLALDQAFSSTALRPQDGYVWAVTTNGWMQVRRGAIHFRHLDQVGSLGVEELEWKNRKPGLFRELGHIDFTTPNGSLVQVEYEKENKAGVEAVLTALQAEKDQVEVDNIILDARTAQGVAGADAAGLGANLKKGEVLYRVYSGASLVEVKRGPGHFQAGTSSVRFRVMKGVSVGYGGAGSRGPCNSPALKVGVLRGTFTDSAKCPGPFLGAVAWGPGGRGCS